MDCAFQGCEWKFSGESCQIESPNYPNDYNNNMDHHWVITTREGYTIMLKILDFSLEEAHDFLDVSRARL